MTLFVLAFSNDLMFFTPLDDHYKAKHFQPFNPLNIYFSKRTCVTKFNNAHNNSIVK